MYNPPGGRNDPSPFLPVFLCYDPLWFRTNCFLWIRKGFDGTKYAKHLVKEICPNKMFTKTENIDFWTNLGYELEEGWSGGAKMVKK